MRERGGKYERAEDMQHGSFERSCEVTIHFRYNLKRKAAEMPPLPLESFLAKMSTHEEQMKVHISHIYRVTIQVV